MGRIIRIKKVEGLVAGVVFGPVRSRRFGRSLGVNPLPADRKICTFDCPYCECGPTARRESLELDRREFPPTGILLEKVRLALAELRKRGAVLDSLTLTGNGETTLHPEFGEIVHGLLRLRDEYFPQAQTVVLTNGTRLDDGAVRRALERVDQCVVKIDAGREATFRAINRPLVAIALDTLVRNAAALGRVVVQSMFVRGKVDNTSAEEVRAWIERVSQIRPEAVQIYSLDRPPADAAIEQVGRDVLQHIAAELEKATGLRAKVF